jgi:hypothetical protein
MSGAQRGGIPVEQNRVDHWNQTIASRMVSLGKKNSNSSLASVNVWLEAVNLSWKVSKLGTEIHITTLPVYGRVVIYLV